jgi:GntR family transcriptional regulator
MYVHFLLLATGSANVADVEGITLGVRWRRVAEDLRRRIAAGEFTDVFPGELALAQEYQVSRHTVREALRELRSTGVVTAGRGHLSRVAPATLIEQPTSTLYSLFESVAAAGLTQRSVVEVLDVRNDPEAAAHLRLAPEAELLYLQRVRLAQEEPLAIDQVWLPAETARPLLQSDFTHTSLYDQLRTVCGIHLTGGREQIQAVVASRSDRERLNLGPGVAILALTRLGCHGEAPFEWRRTRIRGDRFSAIAEFTSSAYRFHAPDHDGAAATGSR